MCVLSFIKETMDKAVEEQDQAEDFYGATLVEEVIHQTVCQMARDLRDGTLSRSALSTLLHTSP
jgi:hypothetical protein